MIVFVVKRKKLTIHTWTSDKRKNDSRVKESKDYNYHKLKNFSKINKKNSSINRSVYLKKSKKFAFRMFNM